MQNAVSVCIPAYNEARNIGYLLEYLVKQDKRVGEILIYADGCTDGTEDVVQKYITQDSRIRLLKEEGPLGKPHASNRLVSEAQYQTLIFLDGDTMPQEGCIDFLVDTLHSDDSLIVVGGKSKRIGKQGSIRDFLLEFLYNSVFCYYLAGSCYAVKKTRTIDKMKEWGFDCMPEEIIGDDTWLEALLKKNEIEIEQKAVVHQPLGTFEEYLLLRARSILGGEVLWKNYPRLHSNLVRERRGHFLTIIYRELRNMPDAKEKGLALVRFLVKFGVHMFYRNKIRRICNELYKELQSEGSALVLANVGRLKSKDGL